MAAKRRVLAILFDDMTFIDFNGPHTAMTLTQKYPKNYRKGFDREEKEKVESLFFYFILILISPANNESYYEVETVALPGNRREIVTFEKVHVLADQEFQV